MKKLFLVFLLACFAFCGIASAIGVEVQTLENEIVAEIDIGVFQATLRVIFEDVIGLTPGSVSITAVQVNPLDPALISRLPTNSLVKVPPSFPLLINLSPTPSSTLSFAGTVDIELSTTNLSYGINLRLFTAPNGGAFQDMTNFSGVGSYRVRGTGGDFSDFLIVVDTRGKSVVINGKFDQLQNSLTTNSSRIEPSMLQNLQDSLDSSRSLYQQGQKLQAADQLEAMIAMIKEDEGISIPNTYRANDPNTRNVAGDLRRRAATLIFSLKL